MFSCTARVAFLAYLEFMSYSEILYGGVCSYVRNIMQGLFVYKQFLFSFRIDVNELSCFHVINLLHSFSVRSYFFNMS